MRFHLFITHQFECSAITRRPLRRPIIGYNTATAWLSIADG
jgi:hypothetical protein